MRHVKPFQFMIATRGIVDGPTLVQRARMAESIGYSHLCSHDHLTAQLAPMPALTAVAMATERLRVCPFVLNNDMRHPAVLAQELASLDLMSQGRVVVGIGAGWNQPEYAADRIRACEDSVRQAELMTRNDWYSLFISARGSNPP